jgi:hypothetical protein
MPSLLIVAHSIDGLTQKEACWFGTLLQARPGLLERVPIKVLSIILDSFGDGVNLRERDSESFSKKPLRLFT